MAERDRQLLGWSIHLGVIVLAVLFLVLGRA